LDGIHIAAGKDNPNPSALHGDFTCQQRGHTYSAGRFDEHLQPGEEKRHRCANLILGHQQDVRHRALKNGEGQTTRREIAHAVGDGCRWGDGQPLTGPKRQIGVVGQFGLDAIDRKVRRPGCGHRGASGQQPAAAHRNEQGIERSHFGQEFKGHRSLASHDGMVVIRWNDRCAGCFGQPAGQGFAVIPLAIISGDPGAIATGGGNFGRRRIGGHDDGGRHAKRPGRQRHALGVVAGRKRHNTPRTHFGSQCCQAVRGPTDLEGAAPLKVFSLEKHTLPHPGIQCPRGQNRSTVNVGGKTMLGGDDIRQRQGTRLCHNGQVSHTSPAFAISESLFGSMLKVSKRAMTQTRPLHGKHILVTRAAHQAAAFVALLEQYGAQVTALPTIAVTDPVSWQPLDAALQRLREQKAGTARHYDWIFFTSANAVRFFLNRMAFHGDQSDLLAGLRVCAIGKATAGVVRDAGLEVDLVPAHFNAEGVVESFVAFHGGQVAGLRVLQPRARMAREVLGEALTALGVTLEVVEAYQTVRADLDPVLWQARLQSGAFDVVTFASPSAALQMAEAFPNIAPGALLAKTKVACIGPVTSQAVRDLGLDVAIEPPEATLPALAEAIAAYFASQPEALPPEEPTGT
jgi:uroporphyrinogen-III synthase